MKNFRTHLIILTILSIVFIPYSLVYADKDLKSKVNIIERYKEDITGDSFNETIVLKGEKLSTKSNYYQNVWAEITSYDGSDWVIPYKHGYKPSLSFIDLNHNNRKEILFNATLNEGKEEALLHIHSLLNKKFIELQIPAQDYIYGSFRDNFQAEIFLSPNQPPKVIDIEASKKEYMNLGIYNSAGQLQEDTTIKKSSVTTANPISPPNQLGRGLETTEKIYGIHDNDLIGTVKTKWYYENGKWINLQTTFSKK